MDLNRITKVTEGLCPQYGAFLGLVLFADDQFIKCI